MTYFYTILFSLGKPQENWYFCMMLLLYKSLLRTESLGPDDRFFVVADKATIEYGKSFVSLARVNWIEVPAPKTVKDGMLLKYMFRPKVDVVVVYLDCDFLAKRKITIDIPADTIALLPEGRPDDSNYCGDFTLDAPTGVSAGMFAFRYGPRCRAVLDEVAKRVMNCSKGYYTLDQPHFNAVVAASEAKKYLPASIVSFNGHGNVAEAYLINCAGCPGDGDFHWKKMIDFFILL